MPPQDVITRDNVSVKVSAVLYSRVIDPRRAIVEVENFNCEWDFRVLAGVTIHIAWGCAATRFS